MILKYSNSSTKLIQLHSEKPFVNLRMIHQKHSLIFFLFPFPFLFFSFLFLVRLADRNKQHNPIDVRTPMAQADGDTTLYLRLRNTGKPHSNPDAGQYGPLSQMV